jgi:uncharacterized protein
VAAAVLPLALLVGVSLSLLGGGGSILTVPLLTYAAGVESKSAIATSLFVVGVTSVAGLLVHARGGRVKWRTGALFGGAAMAGAFVGGRLAAYVPSTLLMILFACTMLGTAAAMLRGRFGSEAEPLARATCRAAARRRVAAMVARGVAVGLVTGLLGAGGGFLIVPALTLLGGLPMPAAVGTSLLVVAMNSFAGLAGYLGHVAIDWQLALPVAGAAIAGSVMGGRLSAVVPAPVLRRSFGWFVAAMATFILVMEALGR